MNSRIIYPTDDGGVSVIIPAPECLAERTIQEIAAKDVPAGKAYKIIEDDVVPSDRTFRNAWEVDSAILTDGFGAESNEFPKEVTE